MGKRKPRAFLVQWKPEEAEAHTAKLKDAGYAVDCEPVTPEVLRRLRGEPPAAVVIDLSRLPSHGRDVGLGLRSFKTTRHVPLVFVDGPPEKVERIRKLLPDAVYTSWSRIRGSLRRAITSPPAEPVVQRSTMAGYSGVPLARKLGIKPGFVVALIGAPDAFESTLGALPEGVEVRRQARGRRNLTIWFCRSRKELDRRIARMTAFAESAGLWIAWPKKASGVTTDLTQQIVRGVALAEGIVDFKICAIDATWSGLRFTERK
jgi:hypothetical protein